MPRSQSKFGAIEFLLLAGLFAVGSVNLIYPFTGDQALFTIGARAISQGAVLYRDFWDLKQPGIYWFYVVGGYVFGFTEIGIHFFELTYFLFFAAVVVIAMKDYVRRPSTAIVSVVLTIGAYFVVCAPWHLTQAEGLVAFPLFLCLLFSLPPKPPREISAGRYFIFGLAAAGTALFKLMLIVLPGSFLILAVVAARLKLEKSFKQIFVSCLIPAGVGVLFVVIPVLGYFAGVHQLDLLRKTFIEYPPRIIAEVPRNDFAVLRDGLKWFCFAGGPLIPLAVVGAVSQLRRGGNTFVPGLICWFVIGLVAVLAQRMWWEYHFLLLLFPIGILAAMGFETILLPIEAAQPMQSMALRKRLAMAALLLTVAPYGWRWSRKVVREFSGGVPLSLERQEAFRERLNPAYAVARSEIAAGGLADQAPGAIYVLGDPLVYFLSGRAQGPSINGWSPEWLLPEQWQLLAQELDTQKPARIFVAASNLSLLRLRGAAVSDVIDRNYSVFESDSNGVWYTLKRT
jgi:hypothetical protein